MYIKSATHISLQAPLSLEWLDTPRHYSHARGILNRAIDPDFKPFIAPMAARRMSPIIKRAIVTSIEALREGGIETPQAIITGTGWGCVENTERFLDAMVRNGEQFLQPTNFIQSTHNTIGSQIAIHLGCNGYNSTYVHGGTSMESALLDAWMQFELGMLDNALVGGHDELTEDYYTLQHKSGYLNDHIIAGEGSTTLLLARDGEKALAKVQNIVLTRNAQNFHFDNVDALILGYNGDPANDHVYNEFRAQHAPSTPYFGFKHLCGEYCTASAFGLYAAVHLMRRHRFQKVLFYNHYKATDHAFITLERC